MKLLKERRHYQIMQRMKEILLNSDRDIGVLIDSNRLFIEPLKNEFGIDELTYTIRLLMRKNYLDSYDDNPDNQLSLKLSIKGFEEWLFPFKGTDIKKIFLSYADADKNLAGEIKIALEKCGFSVFLAHEDMIPTEEFRDRIISELSTCGIFMALRTKRYSRRAYTEQECGFALAFGKRILSLCVDTSPKDAGFCNVYQAHKFEENEYLAEAIVEYCKKQLL